MKVDPIHIKFVFITYTNYKLQLYQYSQNIDSSSFSDFTSLAHNNINNEELQNSESSRYKQLNQETESQNLIDIIKNVPPIPRVNFSNQNNTIISNETKLNQKSSDKKDALLREIDNVNNNTKIRNSNSTTTNNLQNNISKNKKKKKKAKQQDKTIKDKRDDSLSPPVNREEEDDNLVDSNKNQLKTNQEV